MTKDITYLTRPEAPTTPTRKMDFETFLAEFQGNHAEWLPDGTVEMLPEETMAHIQARLDLSALLDVFVAASGAGHLLTRFPLRLGDEMPFREPDLAVVTGAHLERILPAYVHGAADIAIEIVSPLTIARDYGAKFHDYQSGGVTEYWLVDPDRRTIDIHGRGEGGKYARRQPDSSGRAVSGRLNGFAVDPAWLWGREKLASTQIITLVAEMLGVPVESLLK